jgi:glyoxylase-like metal-dependent hydrolase (beta-lactamase superfamily II)
MAAKDIRHWKVGKVQVSRIVELNAQRTDVSDLYVDGPPDLAGKYPWLRPYFASADGQLIWSFQVFVVKCGRLRILIDPGIGNGKVRPNPKVRGEPMFDRLQGSFLQDLAAAGHPPESIDIVLYTHLHLDHVGWSTHLVNGHWVPTFPKARHLVCRSEWENLPALAARLAADGDFVGDSIQPVWDAGLIDLIEPDREVIEEVRLEPTPGHTPAHASVHIQSDDQHAVITGDLLHHPIQCAEPGLRMPLTADYETSCRTLRNFLARYQDRQALVFGSHFADPTAGWIVREGENWRFVPEVR